MTEAIQTLETLYKKATDTLNSYEQLPEKEIKRKHLEVIASEIAASMINLKINKQFADAKPKEFSALFNDDQTHIDNYAHILIQHSAESIMDAVLFQTELIFRTFFSKLTGKTPGEERSLHKIIATLYEDTENAWTKEEAKLVILLWTLRNTIHTGGIYFHKTAGITITYKGQAYAFEFGKTPQLLRDGKYFDLITDLFDSIDYLFKRDLIKGLGDIDHPSYNALGY
ncbi:MAG: hypothetical protein V4539_01180 [Bacteroidota bacterium]